MIKTDIIKGQKSWILDSKKIRLSLTEKGGHMAPVVFMKDSDNPIEPFYINPWADEDLDLSNLPDVLDPLRGDFFCLTFGGDNSWGGEVHPPHGESSGSMWILGDNLEENSITLKMDTKVRKGTITKKIFLKENENNLYISHRIVDFAGPISPGHHVIFPGGTTKNISTSPIKFGYTDDNRHGGYFDEEYYSLAAFKKFDSLKMVPTIWKDKEYTDCSEFPAREGFMDLLQVYNKPREEFAWTAVTVPEEGYLWFALKDQAILPSTVLWMANKGRHQKPWYGRNVCIGVEDVCSHLGDGLSVAAERNSLNEEGIITSHYLKEGSEMTVKYIQGVARIPDGFKRVRSIEKRDEGVEIKSFSGKSIHTKLDPGFLL